ncbi:pilus assembly protein CpaC [Hydrogenophaga palleronii]|uniref:Type IV pilus biogenesis and competence protein PilQ n=1 Tax=Hydrogenophaga palleronii TaxID=65655 RepID=A0ABU1WQB8_9BURK|nr:type II and III secretion system protein family protein [Hydrogenophaga palleronii]MDR7151493.1 pilus assembly protein CpaC [Hydrogenophaga palleronii]
MNTTLLRALSLSLAAAGLLTAVPAQTQTAVTRGVTTSQVAAAPLRSADISTDLATVGPSMDLTVGKSTLLRMPTEVTRISLGNPTVADVTLISPTELYLLGKAYGSTNLIVWRKGGGATAIDVNVNIDYKRMEAKLRELLPNETGIQVRPAADSVILTGVVSSAVKAMAAEEIANAFVRDVNKSLVLPVVAGDNRAESGATMKVASTSGGSGAAAARTAGARVVNLLSVAEAQQVMLEVVVAEVSKTMMEKMGINLLSTRTGGGWTYGINPNFGGDGRGLFSGINPLSGNRFQFDAEKSDGVVKILAEPNLVAVSGQEASFLAGGKIFIPVARDNNATGGTTITLEEKEFGVGVKFTPTVLEGGRIHLKVAPEVSELSPTGTPFTTVAGVTSILPSFTTRRAATTVQLMDGQSLAIAGLIKNNARQALDAVPGLGEVPVLGALFRSNEFQDDRTELMFVITPRLVKPLDPGYALPTDSYHPPSRAEFYLGGQLEAYRPNQPAPADTPPAAPAVNPQTK